MRASGERSHNRLPNEANFGRLGAVLSGVVRRLRADSGCPGIGGRRVRSCGQAGEDWYQG